MKKEALSPREEIARLKRELKSRKIWTTRLRNRVRELEEELAIYKEDRLFASTWGDIA